MKSLTSHHDLDVWRSANAFAIEVYSVTKFFPIEERFGLSSQLRRAAVSISSNIAEGAARHSTREFAHFVSMSLGSTSEIETQLIIAEGIGVLDTETFESLNDKLIDIKKMLIGLRRSLLVRAQ